VVELEACVQQNTYVLANSLQGFRDFGVHPKATNHDLGTAYAALHVCIELAAIVTADGLRSDGQPSRGCAQQAAPFQLAQ
jgi:hypothetical protein